MEGISGWEGGGSLFFDGEGVCAGREGLLFWVIILGRMDLRRNWQGKVQFVVCAGPKRRNQCLFAFAYAF